MNVLVNAGREKPVPETVAATFDDGATKASHVRDCCSSRATKETRAAADFMVMMEMVVVVVVVIIMFLALVIE